jgi:hypothetical protein
MECCEYERDMQEKVPLFEIHLGGDMGEENASSQTFAEVCGTAEGKLRRRSSVIAKLVGARCEVEDVLLSPNGSTVLSASERFRLSILMAAIDNIVQRIEEC